MDYQSQIAYDAGRTFAVDAPVDERLVFLRKTYMLVLAGLGAAAAGGYVGATRVLPYLTGFGGIIAMLVVWIGGYFAVRALRGKPGINYLALFGFAFLCGVVFSPIFYIATAMAGGEPTILVNAVVITGSMVTALSGYVLVTKKDFSFLGGALSILFVGMVALFLIGMFTSSWGLHLMFAGAGALLFAGFVLYDTSRIVRTHPTTDSVGAALDLFVDFFGLFLYVLQLLMMLAGGRD